MSALRAGHDRLPGPASLARACRGRGPWLLPSFVAYLGERGLGTVTVQAALEWAQTSPTERAEHRTAADDRSSQLRPLSGRHRRERRSAAAGSDAELATVATAVDLRPGDIVTVMQQARATIGWPFRAATYETLLGLLAATGCGSARRSSSTAAISTGTKACC